ncbi:MAG: hypothetical protein ACLFQG_09345, partial [Desulfovermiculus sp.]
SDKVQNKDRHPAANPFYYPVHIVFRSGEKRVGMFTLNGIQEAIRRADKNPEDVPKEKKKSFWSWIFGR